MAEPHYSMRIWRLTGRALLAQQVDAMDPDDHRRAAEAESRELQREVHRVLPLPLDRRETLVGAADLEVHRVDPVGVEGASLHNQQVALGDRRYRRAAG